MERRRRYRSKRKHSIRNKRAAGWKRCLAAAAALATVLTGMDYNGLTSVLAEEKSGYEIDVSYPEDKSSAVLTGNTENVPENTTLTGMTGSDGAEYDPGAFTTTVMENGTYTYTINYSVTVAETGKTVDREETLKVTVDGIAKEKDKEKTAGAETAAKTQTQTSGSADITASQTAKKDSTSSQTDSEDSPEVLPLSELEENLELLSSQASPLADGDDELQRNTISIWQYADEAKDYLLNTNPQNFSGGKMSHTSHVTVPECVYRGVTRTYTSAELVWYDAEGNVERRQEISGLYPDLIGNSGTGGSVKWYYTVPEGEDSDGSHQDNPYGDIQVGYRIDNYRQAGAAAKNVTEVRFYYGVPDDSQYTFTVNYGETSVNLKDWNLNVKNTLVETTGEQAGLTAGGGERVPVSFTLPGAFESATLTISGGGGSDQILSTAENGGLTKSGETRNYSGTFDMPLGNVTITVTAAKYATSGDNVQYFAAFSDLALSEQYGSMLGQRDTIAGRARVYTLSGRLVKDLTNQVVNPTYNTATQNYGYGLGRYNSTTAGGEPIISIDKYYSGGNFNTYEAVSNGWADYRPTGTTDDAVPVSLTEGNSSDRVNVPIGNFLPGNDVKVRFETVSNDYSNNDTGSIGWGYVPTVLSIDVYTSKNDFTTGNFVRQTFALPTNTDEQVTYPLDMGGTITIDCKQFDNSYTIPDASGSANQGAWRDANAYARGIRFSNSFVRWKAYEVTVSGCAYSFKLYQQHAMGSQSRMVVTEASGIQQGTGTQNQANIDDIKGSYIRKSNTQNSSMVYSPFTVPAVLYQFNATNTAGHLELGLTVQPGYGPPVLTTNKGTIPYSRIDDEGRYIYQITSSQMTSSLHTAGGTLRISAQPITITPVYKNGTDTPANVTLGYGNNSSINMVLARQGTAPDDQYFQGYNLTVTKEGDTAGTAILNADNESLWSLDDVVNFDNIYTQLQKADYLSADVTDYTLEIKPVYTNDSNNASMVKGVYSIYQQNTWVPNPSNNSYQTNGSGGYTGFGSPANTTIEGFTGSTAVLTGYEEVVWPDGETGRPWVLGRRSTVQGTLTNNPQDVFARLFYAMGVTVRIDTSELESELQNDTKSAVETFNNNNTGVYYTSINNENHSINYSTVYQAFAADEGPGEFLGFRVKVGTKTYDPILPSNSVVNLYLLYGGSSGFGAYTEVYREIWNALFDPDGDGQMVLVPTYDTTNPITLKDDGSTTQTASADTVDVYQNADGKYTVSAEFYMEGSVPQGATAIYAVYAQEEGDSVWGLTERGTVNLNSPTSPVRTNTAQGGNSIYYERFAAADLDVSVEATANGNTRITLTFSGIPRMGPTGIDYRFYMWNEANGNKGNNSNDIPTRFDTTQELDDSFTADYARSWKEYHVIPQVTTEYGSDVTIKDTQESALFYERTGFTLTGTFKLEGDLKENFDYLNRNSMIHVALYKQNPNESHDPTKPNEKDFVIWANKNGAVAGQAGKIGSISISKAGDYEFTVSIEISNLNSGGSDSITNEWDDAASYRIYAWTDSNKTPDTIQQGIFGTAGSKLAHDASIDTIPSVTTVMTGVLGTQMETIISYPKEIRLLDNVVADDDNIYSGNEQITIAAPDGSSEPETDVGVDVTIQEFSTANTFNISRGTGGTDTIAIAAYKGTIGASTAQQIAVGGAVGTLKFESGEDVIPIYFRSVSAPNALDGADYTGTIHFNFAQSTSTTN